MKKTSLVQIQALQQLKVLKHRTLNYYLTTQRFEEAWEQATPEQEAKLTYLINMEDLDNLKLEVKKITSKDLHDKSLKELRDIASQLRIPNYNKYHKEMLVLILKDRV